nr:ribonuclease H-like domain-containing protein [Tanacetum cinerariifolium]
MGHLPNITDPQLYLDFISSANFFSGGISFTQQWEPVFISSGKIVWQWELITSSGNALSILFPTNPRLEEDGLGEDSLGRLEEERDTVVKASVDCNWRNKKNTWNKVFKYNSGSKDDLHKALKDKGIIDSRCSRHMTWNKAHLTDYQEFKGGSVAFGGSNGRITGKVKIKDGRGSRRNIVMPELQQNGVAETKNMTLIEAARTMVLVTKPQNKTPYELLTSKQLIISYLRPFGCHVTILNTIDQLEKFDGKSDSSKNQTNKSAGPKEANNSLGTEANDDQGANSEEIDLYDEHFVLPIWAAYSTTGKSSGGKIEKTTNDAHTNSTNILNVVSTPISTAGPLIALNDDEPSYHDDPSMPHLEDIYASPSEGIFTNSSYDDEGMDCA